MKKILFLVNHEIVIYNFRKELVLELIKHGYEVYICSPNGEKINYFTNLGCKFIEMKVDRHGTNPFTDIGVLLRYIRIIRKIKPLAVLTYTIKPNIYGGIACRITKTHCLPNITGLGTAVENEGIMQKITILLYRLAFKRVDMVFFQNQENQDFFINHKIKMKNYKLLPGSGVNLKEFIPLEYPDDEIIKFVFISRIMKEKGIDQYLEAAKVIKKRYPNTEFHICGFCEEEYEPILKDLENKKVIKYHGLIRDVKEILKECHCTVHPTYYPEGLSNVLLESCACARPIITTNRSGCREVVNDGINGFIVNEKDDKDVVNKLELFIKTPWNIKKNMGLAGRKIVEEKFDRKEVINIYFDTIMALNKGVSNARN